MVKNVKLYSTVNFYTIQNSEVNEENVIIIQKAITKSSVGQYGPETNAKVGSGAAEEYSSSADRSHLPCALSRTQVYGITLPQSQMETTV
jgi:hypothetical protein